MFKFRVNKSEALSNEIDISGSKNAVLPIMTAALLTDGESYLSNVPFLKDVTTMADVLRVTGAKVIAGDHNLMIDTTNVYHMEAPYELVKTMRASIYVLGPLLAKHGRVRVSLPGGCAWGPRPVDLHIKGIEALGAKVEVTHGYIEATCEGRLKGGKFHFPISSVGATANILMAAVLAEGTTVLDNCAVEPEIDALVDYLIGMGAKVSGRGTRTLVIVGVEVLRPGNGVVIPDRIEAGTFLAAGIITRGKVKVNKVNPSHLDAVLKVFRNMNVKVETGSDWVEIDARNVVLKPTNIKTLPYPGFPTDMQPQMMAVLATIPGASIIQETIYLDRFKHIAELDRLGAEITLHDATATIVGKEKLTAAPVMASDLRASAALVIAALYAEGETEISRIYHHDRGYENFEEKLITLGGKIERFRTEEQF